MENAIRQDGMEDLIQNIQSAIKVLANRDALGIISVHQRNNYLYNLRELFLSYYTMEEWNKYFKYLK